MITRRTRDNVLTALLGSILLTSATNASAQGMAVSRFDPSERGSRWFVADSLELGDGRPGHEVNAQREKARVAAGITSSYALRTRLFGDESEGENTRLVEHAYYLHPGASVTISPGARFALDVPVAWQAGQDANLAGHAYQKPPSPRLGDIRAAFDLRAFSLGPATVAGGVLGYLPTGSQEALTSDDYVRFGARVAATLEEGAFHFASRVGYMYRREGFVGGVVTGSEVNAVLAAALASGRWFVGPELWASTFLEDAFGKRSTPVELVIGGHATFGDLRTGLGIGTSVAPGLGSTYLRIALSVEWVPSKAETATSDRDGDGFLDAVDACPDVAGSENGCPPAPSAPPPHPPPIEPDPEGEPPPNPQEK